MSRKKNRCRVVQPTDAQIKPDWTRKCEVCDQTPIVPVTGMCGPCTFGESATAGGAWYTEAAP